MRRLILIVLALAACGDDTTQPPADTSVATETSVAPDTSVPTTTPDTTVTETVADITPDVEDVPVEVEVTPPCSERPNPFVWDQDGLGDWNDFDNAQSVAQVDPPNHRGQDVIIKVGEPQLLVGKFAYGFFDQDMKGEDVVVYAQREVPCGEWEKLGELKTSTDGQYGTTYGIEDDGGRVFFQIPESERFDVGRYPIRMVLKGDGTMAKFDLIVVEPGTQALVTDIDGTLTTGDEELLLELIEDAFNETYVQQMYPDADTMIRTYYEKGYLIVYMTGRPDFLRAMTERWVEPRLSPGALHLTDTNSQAVPNEEGVGTYKTQFLRYLEAQGLDIVVAYGNATTDIYAYEQAEVPKDKTWIIGAHRGEEGTQSLVDSYSPHLPYVDAFPAATKSPPPAFGWW